MLYYAYFTYFRAIFGMGWTEVNFIASMIWSSTLLTSVSLQRNVIDTAVNKLRKWLAVCVCADAQHFKHFLWVSHKMSIIMVKTSQFTTKCKTDCWVIALKQKKNQNNCSIIITKHMCWVLYLNLVTDRFKCYTGQYCLDILQPEQH